MAMILQYTERTRVSDPERGSIGITTHDPCLKQHHVTNTLISPAIVHMLGDAITAHRGQTAVHKTGGVVSYAARTGPQRGYRACTGLQFPE